MAHQLEAESIKKILIVGHSNIGDVVYDLVVIDPLRKHFPHAKIFFLTSPRSHNLAAGYNGIERVIVLDKHGEDKGLLRRIRFHQALKKEKFDLVVLLKKTLMHKFLMIPFGWNIPGACKEDLAKRATHPVDIYLNFLRSKGVRAGSAVFDFGLDTEKQFCDDFFAKNALDRFKVVGFLPLAAASFKNWPIDKWNRLAEVLQKEDGVRMLAFGRSSDDLYAKRVMREISPEIASAIDRTTLRQALALIGRCELFVGPDSSLLHAASCLGVESIGLYGPTPADYIYPYFHRNNIITIKEEPPGMLCLTEPFSCPCRRVTQPSACMEKISVEEVLASIRANLGKKNISLSEREKE